MALWLRCGAAAAAGHAPRDERAFAYRTTRRGCERYVAGRHRSHRGCAAVWAAARTLVVAGIVSVAQRAATPLRAATPVDRARASRSFGQAGARWSTGVLRCRHSAG